MVRQCVAGRRRCVPTRAAVTNSCARRESQAGVALLQRHQYDDVGPGAMQSHVYQRQLTPAERRFYRAPNANVVVTARIKGHISTDRLASAVKALRKRHRLLGVRTLLDQEGNAHFTSEGAGDIVIATSPRHSDHHWIERCLEENRNPFPFQELPPIRFVVLSADEVADLIIVCHHMICDGLSLAYLTRDLLSALGHPQRMVKVLPDPPVACRHSLVSGAPDRLFVSGSIKKLNQDWKKETVLFDEEDYRQLHRAYWDTYMCRVLSLEFTEDETSRFVARCRRERVTANSALLLSLLAAQNVVQGDAHGYLLKTGTAVSIRKLLDPSPDEAIGLYAVGAMLEFEYQPTKPFWDEARLLHSQLSEAMRKDKLVERLLMNEHIEPTILDAVQFKRYGSLVKPNARRYTKLASFAQRRDTVSTLESQRSAEGKRGVILTNLARLDFPRRYGDLELERILFLPGVTDRFEKAVGAVTASGKLTLVISHLEAACDEVVDSDTMEEFRTALRMVLAPEVEY